MTQNSPQSAATEVWRRFAGMFGADALERKFGREIPAEWQAMCGRLNDYQIQRGIRQLAYSGKAHVPSLPEFVKLCRDAEHDARPAAVHPALTSGQSQEDPWGWLANRRLLKHITTVIPENPRRYGQRDTPEFVRAVNIVVAFKNRWADLMRAAATADGVLIADQEAAWNAGMRMAEQEIARHAA